MTETDHRILMLNSRLTALRARNKGLTQSMIADGAGVDQGLVSRLLAGRLRRFTSRLNDISAYVGSMEIGDGKEVPEEVFLVVRAYLDAGGSKELLLSQIDLLRRAQRRRL